jgi:hypothetical protein
LVADDALSVQGGGDGEQRAPAIRRLWTEIDRWARNMPQAFKDLLEFKSDKIALKGRVGQLRRGENEPPRKP